MAHFAKIGLNNIVTDVLVVANRETMDSQGNEQESIGVEFLKTLTGHETWVQTSYNGTIRKNYAGVGYTYDSQRDAFIPPKPFSSWLLNEDTCLWEAPVPYPTDSKYYFWDETILNWVENTPLPADEEQQ
jgi:hypothetical protein